MNFTKRKLPLSAATEVKKITPTSLGPYQILLAPIYLYLERNERYLAIKGPLDFFNEEKWEQVKNTNIYFGPFIEVIGPFRAAAMRIRSLLEEKARIEKAIGQPTESKVYSSVDIGRASYDIAKISLEAVGSLWDNDLKIEPFFAIAFAEALCEPLPKKLIVEAREKDVERYECALLKSSWAVFLLVHLGFANLDYLNRYRKNIFEQDVAGELENSPEELDIILNQLLVSSEIKSFHGHVFKGRDERTAQKLASRLGKATEGRVKSDKVSPSIFGEKGFCDV